MTEQEVRLTKRLKKHGKDDTIVHRVFNNERG